MKRELHIPIYDTTLFLIVTKDLAKARRELEFLFGPAPDLKHANALCSHEGDNAALLFLPEALTVKIIAHEVFHLTHRILDFTNANLHPEHHEHAALLHGFLFDLVWKELTAEREAG